MVKICEQMNAVKVASYLDCAWYLAEIDKCKLTIKPKQYFECTCKERMDDLCVWITKFLKSSPEGVGNRDIHDDTLLTEYGFLLGDYDPAKRKVIMDSILSAINEEKNSFKE